MPGRWDEAAVRWGVDGTGLYVEPIDMQLQRLMKVAGKWLVGTQLVYQPMERRMCKPGSRTYC